MSSVVTRPDGSFGFEHGDGLPLGHEVTAALDSNAPLMTVELNVWSVQSALKDLISNRKNAARCNEVDLQYRYDPYGWPSVDPDRVGKNVLKWLTSASTDEFVEFCVANRENLEQHNEMLHTVEPLLREDVLSRAGKLRQIGLLPVRAYDVYERALSVVKPLRAMDFFESGAKPAGAYYQFGTHTITHRNHFARGPYHWLPAWVMYQNNFHEFGHAAGDLTSGFMQAGTRGRGHRWLEESMVSHATQLSERDAFQPEVFDPDLRYDLRPGAYPSDRRFLHLLVNEGCAPLDVTDLSDAFYAPYGSSTAVRKHVFSRLGRSLRGFLPEYRESGLRAFSDAYEKRYKERRATAWIDRKVEEIMDQKTGQPYWKTGSLVLDDIPFGGGDPDHIRAERGLI